MLKLKNSDLTINYIPYSKDDVRQLVQNRIGSRQKEKRLILNINIRWKMD